MNFIWHLIFVLLCLCFQAFLHFMPCYSGVYNWLIMTKWIKVCSQCSGFIYCHCLNALWWMQTSMFKLDSSLLMQNIGLGLNLIYWKLDSDLDQFIYLHCLRNWFLKALELVILSVIFPGYIPLKFLNVIKFCRTLLFWMSF